MKKVLLLILLLPLMAVEKKAEAATYIVTGTYNCLNGTGICATQSSLFSHARGVMRQHTNCDPIGPSCGVNQGDVIEVHYNVTIVNNGQSSVAHTVVKGVVSNDMEQAENGHILILSPMSEAPTCNLCAHGQGTNCDEPGGRRQR